MKLKRLVSAVLAVGMALTILPTAAFADGTTTVPDGYVKSLKFTADAPDISEEQAHKDGEVKGYPTYVPNTEKSGWDWRYGDTCYRFSVKSGFTYSTLYAPETIPCEVRVEGGGTVKSGYFEKKVYANGNIVGGTYENLEIRGSAKVTGGYINILEDHNATWGGVNATVDGGIVYGKLNMEAGTLTSGIVCSIPDIYKGTYQTLTATGGVITPVIQDETVPDNVAFQGAVYLVGDKVKTRTFTVKPASPTFAEWKIVSNDGAKITEAADHTLTVELAATGDVKIEAVTTPIDLVPSVVDGNVVPSYNGKLYSGSDVDGWYYDSKNNILTVYKDGSIDLGNTEVNWTIDNFGTIKGGIFNYTSDVEKDVLTNESTGKIVGGTFNVRVENNGEIENGTFKQKVQNYSIVSGGTFIDRFVNTPTKEADANNNNVVVANGAVKGGVFSHYADFYGQDDLQKTTLTLNKCTANGISDLVYVVGNQTLTIEADTACTGWEFSTDADYEETVAKQVPTDNKDTFTLTLSGDDERNVTLTALLKEGYYRMNLVDGTATVNDKEATSAKAGDTVKLTAADAPDGMVFDRWEITPTDTALNLEGFDANAATTSFVMPAQTLTIRAMYRMADVEEPNVLGTAAVIGTVAVGGAVIAWQGYNIAADLYAQSILPEGTAIPETKEALAVMLWQNAGKPEVVAADGTALSETEQAQQWVVANGLMENEEDGTFHPEKGVGKFAALNAIKEQNEAKVNE